ncbi:hypothetical protein QYZ45_26955 [Vibrio parahaemolyticus]|nr:hypothetical protein [Vibrio parahaemolyticus]
MNLFIDEALEAQVNVSEGYQGACQIIFYGEGKKKVPYSLVWKRLKVQPEGR